MPFLCQTIKKFETADHLHSSLKRLETISASSIDFPIISRQKIRVSHHRKSSGTVASL